jgi:hypothetical protein
MINAAAETVADGDEMPPQDSAVPAGCQAPETDLPAIPC